MRRRGTELDAKHDIDHRADSVHAGGVALLATSPARDRDRSTMSSSPSGRCSDTRRWSGSCPIHERSRRTSAPSCPPSGTSTCSPEATSFAWTRPGTGKLRGLISQAFTPRMIHGLAHRIAELTAELLDKLGGADRFDLVDGLAYPLPVIVIAELLGIPVADRPIFRQLGGYALLAERADIRDQAGRSYAKALFDAVAPTMREMNGYLLAHIQRSPRPSRQRPDERAGDTPRSTGNGSTTRRSSGSSGCS